MNRVHELAGVLERPPRLAGVEESLTAMAIAEGLAEPQRLAAAVGAAGRNHEARARGDALRIELFRAGLPAELPIAQVPDLSSDIHDIQGLRSLHSYLFPAQEGSAEPG